MTRTFIVSLLSSFLLFCAVTSQAAMLPKVNLFNPMSIIIIIDDIPARVEVSEDDPISISGNPAANGEWISVISSEEINVFSMINSSGEEIENREIHNPSFKFMMEDISAGIYYLRFELEGSIITKTFVVE